jgi:putative radical SAM enzyme (TIGR03279 family)
MDITLQRRGRKTTATLQRKAGEPSGLSCASGPVRRCTNRCIFCFIDQLPAGMRRSLYVKDEDFRHSFLYGTYITLTSLGDEDFSRITAQFLSPLYISVHATDPATRVRMLGNRRAGAIRSQLRYLDTHGIAFHAQLVICPGVNDGAVFERSVTDLLGFSACRSIAVVPVGLTRFHTGGCTPVSAETARHLCNSIASRGTRDKAHQGVRRLFAADELFLRAGLPIPPRAYYEDFPQIENGVGLLRHLLDEWEQCSTRITTRPDVRPSPPDVSRSRSEASLQRVGIVTAAAAGPFLEDIAQALHTRLPHIHVRVFTVTNRFFGATVTVAGLLTARDVLRVVKKHASSCQLVFIPAVMFNSRDVSLDGYSFSRMCRLSPVPLVRSAGTGDIISYLH